MQMLHKMWAAPTRRFMQAIASMLEALEVTPGAMTHNDVLAHLQRLFNSRQGQSLSAPLYGMALGIDVLRDLLTHLPQTTATLEHAIFSCAKMHERRLKEWRLREPTALGAHALTLHMAAEYTAFRREVHFDVHIAPSGRVTVQQV